MKQLLSILILLITVTAHSQGDSTKMYRKWVTKADSLYNAKSYEASSKAFAKGFSYFQGKAYPNDRYNAACSFALAKNKKQALYHLERIVDKSMSYAYSNYDHWQKDSDLNSLHTDKRWKKLMAQVEAYKQEAEKDLDHELKAILDSVYEQDQGIRQKIGETMKKYEPGSPEIQAFYKEWRRIDSSNEVIVTKILDERGWLGADVVGQKGNTTLFLVIQHAPLETQEKYLPMMRKAVEEKKARGSSLALLEDRVLLRNGQKQIYGSQVGKSSASEAYYILPLEDPHGVDERRKSVGLTPLQDYVGKWGIEWNPDEYVKKLPEYENIYFEEVERTKEQ